MGTFVVLDLTIVSPSAFMQALLSMWKIIPTILWVRRTPLPMGLHCQNPLFIGEKSPKGPQAPLSSCRPRCVQPDGPSLHSRGLHPNPSMEEERQMEMLLPCSVNLCLETHASRLITQDLSLETHASRLMPSRLATHTPMP